MTKEETDKLKVETDKMEKDLDDLKKLKPNLSEKDLFEEFSLAQFAPNTTSILSTHCLTRDEYTPEMWVEAVKAFDGLKLPKTPKP